MQKGTLLALILCLTQICFAQKEGNIWYFGVNAGLNFNTNPPTPLTGVLNTSEGSASIADPITGQLLMYTDGTKVWDRNHNQMPANVANPLKGHVSSTQSALIIPKPGSSTHYYIFTAGATGGNDQICWSMVDMSLNGGNGDLISFNNPLFDTATEKLTAVANCDRSVYWIVAHKRGCDSFYAFRMTANGIETPVKSKTGVVHPEIAGSTGYMKFSPDGRKLGLVLLYQNTMELFDFNFNTGIVSNPITDSASTTHNLLYGCSFSPDGSKFYISAHPGSRRIIQYDMDAGSPAAVLASKVEVGIASDTFRSVGAIQNGPDGKMYIVTALGNSIDVINNPNAAGTACNYQPKAIYYNAPNYGYMGLPNFVESIFTPLPAMPAFDVPQHPEMCKGDTVWAPQATPATFIITPATGFSVNTDTTLFAFHPDVTTTYTVVVTDPCHANDTIQFTITVSSGPDADFTFLPEEPQPSDASIKLINQSSRAQSYQWFDQHGVFLSSTKDHLLPHPGLGTFCYTLVASDSIGCTDTAQKCVDIKDPGSLLIPNTFSPNGDGLNDVFRIYGLYLELLEFSVYNRYGERIFYTVDKSTGWDGRYKAKQCDAGTYYYLIRLIDGYGKKLVKKGDVNLIF